MGRLEKLFNLGASENLESKKVSPESDVQATKLSQQQLQELKDSLDELVEEHDGFVGQKDFLRWFFEKNKEFAYKTANQAMFNAASENLPLVVKHRFCCCKLKFKTMDVERGKNMRVLYRKLRYPKEIEDNDMFDMAVLALRDPVVKLA